jgi:hypothetical protein
MHTSNCGPMARNFASPHDASKEAGRLTIQAGHMPSMRSTLSALKHAGSQNAAGAAKSHLAAARQLENAAGEMHRQGRMEQFNDMHEAASAHRRAASLHRAGMPSDDLDDDEDDLDVHSDDAQVTAGRAVDATAPARGVGGPVPQATQDRGDVRVSNSRYRIGSDGVAIGPIDDLPQVLAANSIQGIHTGVTGRAPNVLPAGDGKPLKGIPIRNRRKWGGEGIHGDLASLPNMSPEIAKLVQNRRAADPDGSGSLSEGTSDPGDDDPSFDARDDEPAKMRAGLEDESQEDVTPLDRMLGNPEKGEVDSPSTRAARVGLWASYDSHDPASIDAYARAIQARNQAVVNLLNALDRGDVVHDPHGLLTEEVLAQHWRGHACLQPVQARVYNETGRHRQWDQRLQYNEAATGDFLGGMSAGLQRYVQERDGTAPQTPVVNHSRRSTTVLNTGGKGARACYSQVTGFDVQGSWGSLPDGGAGNASPRMLEYLAKGGR